ncbi:MAG: formate dehydrogenase accessory sulfurtransferase FdhD [Tissierellia bacterium]|nr:formate dehydrogenase accessory sulfurtransferase FdhD [Tissierellia bacterium]
MKKLNSVIILAGGQSMRMGFDKQTLTTNGKTHLESILSDMQKVFSEIIISSNNPDALLDLKDNYSFTIVQDELKDRGALAGIHAGLELSSSDYTFVTAVDMPNIDLAHINLMKGKLQTLGHFDGLVNINRKTNDIEPFFAFYHSSMADEIKKMTDEESHSVKHFIDRHNFAKIQYPLNKQQDMDIFYNINNKKELRDFQERMDPDLKRWSSLTYQAEGPILCEREIIRYKNERATTLMDEVVTETTLDLIINGINYERLYCTPKDIYPLIVGHLFVQGLIDGEDEIKDYNLSHQDGKLTDLIVEVSLFKEVEKGHPIVTSSGLVPQAEMESRSSYKEDVDIVIDSRKLQELSARFQDISALFVRTGGSHATALIHDGKIVDFKEDIGRHNALDKLIGKGLIDKRDLSQCLVMLSGRMASEMTRKIIRTPITGLFSKLAPTDRSIDLAKKYNLTMIGFIRGPRMNVYNLNKGHRIV